MDLGDPFAALNAIPRELSDTRTAVNDLHKEVLKDRRKIRWLRRAFAVIAVAALASIGWTAYQQAVINSQQAVINSKSAAIARLADQNAARGAAEARNAHDLCVKLNRSRAVIAGVWAEVQFRPGANPSALLAKVEAAEPLGKCPRG